MSLVPLDSLPDDARVWCFGASERPSDEAVERLRPALARFLEGWTAHRADLRAGFAWLHDRFLVVAVDEADAGASGCSIDALIAEVRRLEADMDVRLLEAAPVWYRDRSGDVRRVTRDRFRELAERGEIGPSTPVFDLAVQRLEAIRSGAWQVEAGRSWHARLL